MTNLIEGSKDWKIAVMLVEQNHDKPDTHNYCGGGISCVGIACAECPYNEDETTVTLGQLRKAVMPKEAVIGFKRGLILSPGFKCPP